MCVLTCTRCVVCLAVTTDQNGSAHVVLCRPSIDKMQFALLPIVVRCFLCRSRDPCFLSLWAHQLRGTAQATSIASLDERKVRAVAFTTNSFIQCCWAEQLLDTCTRSRQEKSAIHVEVVRGEFCADSKLLILRPPVACSIDLFDHGLAAPGGWYPS